MTSTSRRSRHAPGKTARAASRSRQSNPRELTQDELDLVEETEADPNFFASEILGRDRWDLQRQIASDLTVPHVRVTVKGCNAAGKTNLAADTVLWWTIHGGITITTAPTFRQVTKTMWPAIRLSHAKALYPLGGTLLQTELQIAPDVFALGMSTDSGVNALGFHGRILIVIDEAPGIGTGIFDAVRGIRAGGDVRILMLGNPDVEGGPYSDSFLSPGYRAYTISAFDTPNLSSLRKRPDEPWQATLETLLALSDDELDFAPRPYLATRRWVKEMHDECGIDSPLWESRVLAQFPKQSAYAAFPLAWLEEAKKRVIDDADIPADAEWQAGIDVAEAGEDETALCVRHGPKIVHERAWATDPETIQGEVIAELLPFRDKPGFLVAYDALGVGAYFATPLKQKGFKCAPVKVSRTANDRDRFHLLRDELHWSYRERMKPDAKGNAGVSGLTNVKAFRQLAAIRTGLNTQGQRVIESKDAMRERGVKSPDQAEAQIYAFAPRRLLRYSEGLSGIRF